MIRTIYILLHWRTEGDITYRSFLNRGRGACYRPAGVYVDATFGGGGHSREILSRLNSEGRLYGFDQDADAMGNVPDDPRFTFVYGNFRYMRNFMRWYGYKRVNGILADLGVSWHHLTERPRFLFPL